MALPETASTAVRRPVVRGEVGGTALHDAAFAALPLAGKHLRAAPAGKGTAERPGVAGRPRGHTGRGDGIAQLIEQRHALPPRPCENADGATVSGLQRGKLTLKVYASCRRISGRSYRVKVRPCTVYDLPVDAALYAAFQQAIRSRSSSRVQMVLIVPMHIAQKKAHV